MAIAGEKIHIIWAGDERTRREYRGSSDAGRTRSESQPIFGELHGQAAGDALVIDETGTLHFLSQIRWPQAIYHAELKGNGWSEPSVAYLIALGDSTREPDSIHAHAVRAAIAANNQLVVTFTNSSSDPQRILYGMHQLRESTQQLPNQIAEALLDEAVPSSVAGRLDAGTDVDVPRDTILAASNLEASSSSTSLDALTIGIAPGFIVVTIVAILAIARRRS